MKEFTAAMTNGDYTAKYTVLAYDKDDADKRLFAITGKHLKIKEVK